MSKFIKACSCPVCDNLIKEDGYTIDFTTEGSSIPVIDLSLFACTEFVCEKCGTTVYTGDTGCLYEYEEDEDFEPEDDEEDEDDKE